MLVVISIISLLSSVVLSSLKDSRIKARDTKIFEEMRQVQLALELFKTDHGRYPSTKGCTSGANIICNSNGDFAGKPATYGLVGIDSLVQILSNGDYIDSSVLGDYKSFNWYGNGYQGLFDTSTAQTEYACTHVAYTTSAVTDDIKNKFGTKGMYFP